MTMATAHTLQPLLFLSDDTYEKDQSSSTGLIVLNCPLVDTVSLHKLWQRSCFRICADGGANRLYDMFNHPDPSSRETCLPDEIHGDLDSLRDDVRTYYTNHNVPITQDADQYHADFEKSIGRVFASVRSLGNVLVLGSLSGRVDQGLGLLSEFYRQQQKHPKVAFWLISEDSISFVLPRGKTVIELPLSSGLITENVGLLPIFGEARITLDGFEWNVSNWHTVLGGQISTSNHIKSDRLVVSTDREVLFTVERAPLLQ